MLLTQSAFTHELLYIDFLHCGDPDAVFMYVDQQEFQHLIDAKILDPNKTYMRIVVYPIAWNKLYDKQ